MLVDQVLTGGARCPEMNASVRIRALAEKEFAGVLVVTQTCDGVFRPIVTAVSEMV